MNTEIEATFTNIDKADLRTRLEEAGAKLVYPERITTSNTFDLEDISGNFWKWARVRQDGEEVTMTYKHIEGDNEEIENQKEIEVVVDDFQTATDFLKAVGLPHGMYQEKKRELWDLDGVEIMIDTWPHLEPICEIEGKSKEAVEKIANKLDFDYSEALFCGAGKLYEMKYGTHPDRLEDLDQLTFGSENPYL